MSGSRPTLWEYLRQSLKSVEGGYDLLAPKFDQSPYITPEEILEPFFYRLSEEQSMFEHGLDLCCGTGAATLHLAGICESVTGVDLSTAMLDQCQTKLTQAGVAHRVSLIKANALDLPFNEKFDLVVSFGAFGHIEKSKETEFVSQIFKVLRPGGCFYFITTFDLPRYSFSYWMQRGFNFLMRIRNFLIRPKFIMYYLTFKLPEIAKKLDDSGFAVEVSKDLKFNRRFNYLIPLKYFHFVRAEKKIVNQKSGI